MAAISPAPALKISTVSGSRAREGEGENSRFLNYATEISWEWVRLAWPASLEDIAMR